MLPRVADAAVDLDAVLQDPAGRFAGGGLGDVARPGAIGVVAVDGHRRVVHRRGRPLRARATCRRACAGSPGTSRSARRTACAPSRTRAPCRRCGARCRPSRRRARVGAVTPARVVGGRGRAAGASSCGRSTVNRRREKSTVATNRAGTSAASTTASSGSGQHDGDALDAVGFEHEGDASGRRRARRCRSCAVVAGQRGVPGRSRGTARARPRSRSPRGTGRGRPRRRAERGVLREVSPQRLVHRRVVDVRAHERGRALALEQLAAGVAQQLLVGGEREVHGLRRLSASGGPARAGR